MNRRFANTCPDKRRSVVIVMVCVTIPVITGFAALTVDLGRLFCTRAELQITAPVVLYNGALIHDPRLGHQTVLGRNASGESGSGAPFFKCNLAAKSSNQWVCRGVQPYSR